MSFFPTLLLATKSGAHAGRSGYTVLADYVPNATLIETSRKVVENGLPRIVSKILRQGTVTDWYNSGSLEMEWAAVKALRAGFDGLLHVLWADCDLGFLDLLSRKHPICGTFHCCPDTLKEIITFPGRLKALDGIIVMSEYQRSYFEDAGVNKEKIHVVLHGVDTCFFRPEVRASGDSFVVLSVGGTRRNFPLLVSVARALEGNLGILFKVIGPQSIRRFFPPNLANVEIRTQLSDDELLRAYQDASCLLMTAEDATANNAILEAMACGIPIIAEAVGGIPEYVSDDCAILTEPGNVDAIAEAIRTIQEKESLRSDMAAAARRRAEELDWQHSAAKTIAVYQHVLDVR